MFRGVFNINMDVKGRMAMPTKHRDALNSSNAGQLIVTIDPNSPCLLIYPLSDWEAIEQKIQNLPAKNSNRRFQRLVLGHASELEMDASGRVLLPPKLRDYAGLEKKLVLAGQGKKFELWDEIRWDEEVELAIADIKSDELEVSEELQNLVM